MKHGALRGLWQRWLSAWSGLAAPEMIPKARTGMPMLASISAALGSWSPAPLPDLAASMRQAAASRQYMSSGATPFCVQLAISQSPNV